MASYILTHKAVEDLSKIWNYTIEVWSETQADQYYLVIHEACQDLAEAKVQGKHYPEVHEDIRGFKVGLHIIFYRKLKGTRIEIARILHSRMDLKNRIQE